MRLKERLARLDTAVTLAADRGGVRSVSTRGHDGAAWVWLWRDIQGEAVAEVAFRAWSNGAEEMLQFEIIGLAWRIDDRQLATSATYDGGPIDATLFPSEAIAEHPFVLRASGALHSAWKGSRKQASHLIENRGQLEAAEADLKALVRRNRKKRLEPPRA